MKIRKDLVIAALAVFCLTTTLFIVGPTKSNPGTSARAGSGKTWFVGPPPSDFASIQEAINDPNVIAGDAIEVKWKSIPYYEQVNVTKMLQIRHYSFDPAGYYPTVETFLARASGVEISGFVVNVGISLYSSDNTVLNNTANIDIMEQSCNNTLRQNCMSYFAIETGPYLAVPWNKSEHFVQDIDSSNMINDRPVYYLVNQRDAEVPTDAGFAAVVSSENVSATNLAPESSSQGLLIVDSTIVNVANLSLKSHSEGIFVGNSSQITIKNFKCLGSSTVIRTYGVRLESVNDSCIQNVTFDLGVSGDPAISVSNSQNISVKDNVLFSTTGGFTGAMFLEDSNSTSIEDNIIENSGPTYGGSGIAFARALSNTVVDNTIDGTIWALAIDGLNGSIIFHNNFLSNQEQVYATGINVNNSFDNGFEGNFWRDYNGQDVNGDGIGDTPYSTVAVTDRYPLMVPWSENRTYERPMQKKPIDSKWIQKLYTISNATLGLPLMGFAFNRTLAEIALKVTCGYDGFLNITVPRSWIDGPFNVTVDEVPTGYSFAQNSNVSTFYIVFGSGKHDVKIRGGEVGSIRGDMNGDGIVDIFDAIILAANFNTQE